MQRKVRDWEKGMRGDAEAEVGDGVVRIDWRGGVLSGQSGGAARRWASRNAVVVVVAVEVGLVGRMKEVVEADGRIRQKVVVPVGGDTHTQWMEEEEAGTM